jgi:NAD(P)H dehydrogenase (quinone)
MRALIVTAHPDPDSLTHHAARRLRALVGEDDAVIADLAAEGFDPRFTAGDRADYRGKTVSDPDVIAEQRRIDEADHLVLVFPVYWWSMPALLKGWIDRVFIGGWAFDFDEDDRITRRLGHLTIHLLPVAGDDEASYERHGYAQSFSTQIEHGIIEYCGAKRGVTAFIRDSEGGDDDRVARDVDAAVAEIAAAIRHAP